MSDVLEQFIGRFFGHGDPKARIWFVGMEEGGESDKEALFEHLNLWDRAGQPEISELGGIRSTADSPWFTGETPKIQPTWGKLIRSVLTATGRPVTRQSISAYQAREMGRKGGDMCLLELMPLPAKDVSSWPYADYAEIPYLKSRAAYMEAVAPARIAKLQSLISTYSPAAVVFYSLRYRNYWHQIVGTEIDWQKQGQIEFALGRKTDFFCLPHPTGFGVKNQTYEDLGALIANRLRKEQ